MNLYRQKYCGCIISFNERKQKIMEVIKWKQL
jgi:predicted adenine nucleotide alpha hydrolase (AANH) superfamily ATPase